ncbi:MAG TPA: hypothetical protein VFW68_10225 [Rhodocyclaceae bacterium]|nr:hypothetical protein [Rhodocyclaceae bacterium]
MKPAFHSSVPALLLAAALMVGGCTTNPAVGSGASAQKPAAETPNVLQVSDVSIPPGSKLDAENSLIIGTGDRWVGRIVLKTDLAPVQVFNHIYSGMPSHGWSLVTAVQAKVSNMTYLRGERVASIQIESSLGGSQVAITVSARQGQDAPVRPAAK